MNVAPEKQHRAADVPAETCSRVSLGHLHLLLVQPPQDGDMITPSSFMVSLPYWHATVLAQQLQHGQVSTTHSWPPAVRVHRAWWILVKEPFQGGEILSCCSFCAALIPRAGWRLAANSLKDLQPAIESSISRAHCIPGTGR